MSFPTRNFSPPNHPSPAFYSHISLTSPNTTLVTLAGQIGRAPHSDSVPASLAEQVSIALSNVDHCLAAVGATHADIVSVRQYVVNLDPKEEQRKRIYAAWMDAEGVIDRKAPSTVIGVMGLAVEGCLYEIEVVAAMKDDGL